jgi:hypothetical protein
MARIISIGIMDGPKNFDHPSFDNSGIRPVNEFGYIDCKRADLVWCIHGTFITGILASNRGLNVPVIYPDCE